MKGDPEVAATPVVVLCSSDRGEDRAKALRAGADDVIGKPISRTSLIEAVQRFLRFAAVRGLPRAPFRTRVRIDDGHADWWGTARNVSRGGIYVEAEKELALSHEVRLEFELPDTSLSVRPTAEVVWLDRDEGGEPHGGEQDSTDLDDADGGAPGQVGAAVGASFVGADVPPATGAVALGHSGPPSLGGSLLGFGGFVQSV